MRPNIRQVAERAGVSRTTVSNVLLGRQGVVAPEKFELVLRIVKELDYVPVRPSLQNRHNETRVIALPLDEPGKIGWGINTGTYIGMCQAAMANNYDVMMLLRPNPDWAKERGQVQLLDRRSDGIVFASPHIGESQAVFETLVRHDIPTVVCYRRDVPDCVAWVDPDNLSIVEQQLDHLMEMGHRRIGYLTDGVERLFDTVERQRYFEAGVRQRKLAECADLVFEANFFQLSESQVQSILESGVTALACHNDLLAIQLIQQLASRGVRVPEDMSVIGVDGQDAEAHGLTSVEFSFFDVGYRAVEALVARIQGAPETKWRAVVPAKLKKRQSVKNLAGPSRESRARGQAVNGTSSTGPFGNGLPPNRTAGGQILSGREFAGWEESREAVFPS